MKRTLLPIAAIAFTAICTMANEHTLVFDGDNDMYGITRQTTNDVNEVQFSQELSFTEAGIDFSITKISETGKGFALVNAGGNNAGIYIYAGMFATSGITPKVTLTVPNGKITAAKLYMSGESNNAGCSALDVNFNGTEVSSVNDGSLYFWAWSDSKGVETVSIEWTNNYFSRYIHSIGLTYTEDLHGKKECGLAFSTTTAEAIIGETFTAPKLANPNSLPIRWTSSDESIATVSSDGTLTLLKGGKTTITASTEGNDQYAPGNARYELHVIPSASNIAQMKDLAPELFDCVKVNFPVTVTFANISYAFVIDAEGNAGCFEDIRNHGSTSTTSKTIYKPGEVIPGGWIATNATMYESVIWQGLPDDVTETVEITYPTVEAVTPADVDRVVILKQVTFAKSTPYENSREYGTTPDGTSYEFQNTYNVTEYPAGTYDVTCVVRYSKRGSTEYFYLSPIAYVKSDLTGIATVDATEGTARYFNLQGIEVPTPEHGIYVKVADGKASKVIFQ